MAEYAVTLTDEQNATLTSHIEINDAESVGGLLQATADALCVQVAKAEQVRSWETLSDTAKEVAIVAGAAEDAKEIVAK